MAEVTPNEERPGVAAPPRSIRSLGERTRAVDARAGAGLALRDAH